MNTVGLRVLCGAQSARLTHTTTSNMDTLRKRVPFRSDADPDAVEEERILDDQGWILYLSRRLIG